jgi:hypothetical protein
MSMIDAMYFNMLTTKTTKTMFFDNSIIILHHTTSTEESISNALKYIIIKICGFGG